MRPISQSVIRSGEAEDDVGACAQPLHGPIDPAQSTFKIMSTKTEVTLLKADGRSWPSLEYSPGEAQSVLTFGASGRVGSVGSKNMPDTHKVHAKD